METAVDGASMQAISRMFVRTKHVARLISVLGAFSAAGFCGVTRAQPPTYSIDQGVALADSQNPDILIARKKFEAARGGLIEARAGYLPSVITSGFADKRQTQTTTDLREEDYNASIRALENVYTGGAVSNQVGIAQLMIEKQRCELEEVRNKVAMDVRIGFYDVLLNRSKVRVRENSVRVLDEELKTQEERLKAGIVGTLNVRRAQVALANEQPELANAKTELGNSYLRLGELFGVDYRTQAAQSGFEVAGQLQYAALHPDLNECLGRADAKRAEIKARQLDVEIEDRQYLVDRSELRPHVQLFSGTKFTANAIPMWVRNSITDIWLA